MCNISKRFNGCMDVISNFLFKTNDALFTLHAIYVKRFNGCMDVIYYFLFKTNDALFTLREI